MPDARFLSTATASSVASARNAAPFSPPRQPRILFLNHSAALGGGELSLLDIVADWKATSTLLLFDDGPFADRLRERNLPFACLAPDARLHAVTREASPIDLLRGVPAVLRTVARVAERARDADLLYANSQKAMVLAALVGAWTQTPVVWHLRDMITPDHFSAANRRFITAMANAFVDRVICNSEATRKAFIDAGGRPGLCRVVMNGIDPAPFDAISDAEARACRRTLGCADVPLVGLFSRFSTWKGQHVLVDALADLPGVHALLVGDAIFDVDATYKADLLCQIEALGLQDRVHCLGFRDDVPTLMKAVDVVVHTSTAPEPFGRVVVEAMMARRPVVAADAGGPSEILTDGATGRLVPPGDAAALRNVLADLVAHPERRTRLADAGYHHANAAYSVDTLLRRVRAEIDAMV